MDSVILIIILIALVEASFKHVDIFNEFMKELAECKVDTEAKMEDIIISGLITNAPKQVIIHHKENCLNTEFIDTIVNVFGDRVFYCAGCANCESTKLKNIKLNN